MIFVLAGGNLAARNRYWAIANLPGSLNDVVHRHGVSRRWMKMVRAGDRAPKAGAKKLPSLRDIHQGGKG